MTDSEYLNRPDAEGHLKVRQMLREWDPIGVINIAPDDEYDSYAPEIVRLLDRGVSADELTKVLGNIQKESMGLEPNLSNDRKIATELVNWWRQWKRS